MSVQMEVLLLKVHFGYLSLMPDETGKPVTWVPELSDQQHVAQPFRVAGIACKPGGVALLGNCWEPCKPDHKLDQNPEVAEATF